MTILGVRLRWGAAVAGQPIYRTIRQQADDARLLEELYLLALTRLPAPAEVQRSQADLRQAASRLEGYQDVLWSLLNRHDFIVNH